MYPWSHFSRASLKLSDERHGRESQVLGCRDEFGATRALRNMKSELLGLRQELRRAF